ncbi:glycosyltransferase family 2 protein [Sphingomonas mesophila]|uniref:glycosyltransferase family 2 protein n=1 Tax=Sphingomonas mesophila TaxID=2303576 RepID=UPI000E571840|nr:glycosyltransferase [Sphingomonas mesophila]
MTAETRIGAVVIGRNEGERLETCLRSVIHGADLVVYVDSGSSDGSVELARGLGVDVVELDTAGPFTAARGRNAGFKRIIDLAPATRHVQFIDGDCELREGWMAAASAFLAEQPDVAVACGRLRERYPEASPYNRLCDMEWDTPVGEIEACGGIAMMRADAFATSTGFAEDLIAGEEPDLCFRLRQAGWRIIRLDTEMALHDAAMHRIGQWWQRARRSGYADLEAYRRRGSQVPRLRRKVWSNLLWALPPAWLLWPLLWIRVSRKRGALYATHIVVGKLPNFLGQASFLMHRLRGSRPALIEHKKVHASVRSKSDGR